MQSVAKKATRLKIGFRLNFIRFHSLRNESEAVAALFRSTIITRKSDDYNNKKKETFYEKPDFVRAKKSLFYCGFLSSCGA